MKRALSQTIQQDADRKIILLSGPRQVGKTTLAKDLFPSHAYLSVDRSEDLLAIHQKRWDRSMDALILDELHKMPDWKRWLKGIYDTDGIRPRLIATGSAQFDVFRHVGDSLAGRYFSYRLHPLDIREACFFWKDDPIQAMQRIMSCSGFPEPFLMGDVDFYRRWQKTHMDMILRQDFIDMYAIRHIKMLELLFGLLNERVASPLSYASLGRDLQVDHKTIRHWVDVLERLYGVFLITPYHRNIARSILKEPKLYMWDVARIKNDGSKLENLVASALLKGIHMLEDTKGLKGSLHYLRTKDGHEIDFCVGIEDKIVLAIEVKQSDVEPSRAFRVFREALKDARRIQLVANLKRDFTTPEGVEVRSLPHFLRELDMATYMGIQ